MVSIPDGFTTSEPGPYNEVANTGRAYLDAARVYRIRLMRKTRASWLFVPDWYVVHHLSFISVELYLKSFGATDCHTLQGDESGPFDQFTVPGYHGHKLNDKGIPSSILLELRTKLSLGQYQLLNRLREKNFTGGELAVGRYPYERKDNQQGYPSGVEGRQRAEDWLALAKSLRNFRMRISTG